jgi:flagellar hook-associated protein 2
MAINSLTSSSSSASSAFNFDGVVSGLNTSSIIDKMMTLEQGPLNQLTKQQTDVQNRDAAYQAIETQVTTFQAALNNLLIPSNVNAKAVASTTTGVATATAGSDATNGTYSVNVTRLATTTSVGSSTWNGTAWTTAPIGGGLQGAPTRLNLAGFRTTPTSGTFTINGTQITIDAVNNTLDDVVNAINSSAAGVTASVTTDANGRQNYITLHSTSGQPIQLGSGSDTSNFLAAAHLVSTGVAGDLTSSVPLGTINTSSTLGSDTFATPLTASTGSFMVNGKTITWDASKDTLSSVLGKINSSGAGVTAIYDPTTDSVRMTNVATGSQSIDLNPSADTGGFLAAMHLTGGTAQQTLGQTAQFSINGGPTQYSNSNQISSVLPGVQISLAGTGTTTLTVSQDTQKTIDNVNSFVKAFNDLVDLMDKDTAYNASTNTPSVLTGDAGIQGLEDQLKQMVTNAAPGVSGQYTSLASLGISTGAFGASVGTTNHLTVDTTKLTQALQSNPSAVLSVMIGSPTATINPGSNGTSKPASWISSASGLPADPTHGTYKVSVSSSGQITSVFTPVGGGPLAPLLGSITANGSNSSVISGMTLGIGALPASGTLTDTISFGASGVLSSLGDFLTTQLGKGGVFDSEHTSSASELTSLGDQIKAQNDILAQKQQTLQQQFTAMETALAQLNSQNGQLLASLGSATSSSTSSSSKSSS